MKKVLDYQEWGYSWDDDNMLGDFYLECPCGKEVKTSVFQISEDKLRCDCGRIFRVERTTKVIYEEHDNFKKKENRA